MQREPDIFTELSDYLRAKYQQEQEYLEQHPEEDPAQQVSAKPGEHINQDQFVIRKLLIGLDKNEPEGRLLGRLGRIFNGIAKVPVKIERVLTTLTDDISSMVDRMAKAYPSSPSIADAFQEKIVTAKHIEADTIDEFLETEITHSQFVVDCFRAVNNTKSTMSTLLAQEPLAILKESAPEGLLDSFDDETLRQAIEASVRVNVLSLGIVAQQGKISKKMANIDSNTTEFNLCMDRNFLTGAMGSHLQRASSQQLEQIESSKLALLKAFRGKAMPAADKENIVSIIHHHQDLFHSGMKQALHNKMDSAEIHVLLDRVKEANIPKTVKQECLRHVARAEVEGNKHYQQLSESRRELIAELKAAQAYMQYKYEAAKHRGNTRLTSAYKEKLFDVTTTLMNATEPAQARHSDVSNKPVNKWQQLKSKLKEFGSTAKEKLTGNRKVNSASIRRAQKRVAESESSGVFKRFKEEAQATRKRSEATLPKVESPPKP